MKHLTTASLLALTACHVRATPAMSWDELPVTVAISSALSEYQILAVHGAERVLEEQVGQDLFELRLVDEWDPLVNGLPAFHTVGVSVGPVSPWSLDDAALAYDRHDGRIYSVDVRLGEGCTVREVAHELGHALGLLHSRDGLMLNDPASNATSLSVEEAQAVVLGTYSRPAVSRPWTESSVSTSSSSGRP